MLCDAKAKLDLVNLSIQRLWVTPKPLSLRQTPASSGSDQWCIICILANVDSFLVKGLLGQVFPSAPRENTQRESPKLHLLYFFKTY